MRYSQIQKGFFVDRPNRFIAHVLLQGETVVCHVKNTGRLRELLQPGVSVYLEDAGNPQRKTRYDLVAVEKDGQVINIDSQAPNHAAGEWLRAGGLFPNPALVKAEQVYQHSRFDFYIESTDGRKAFLEVKGVTLLEDGIARFPDAPTTRGVKHIEELADCLTAGYEAYLLFVLEMKGVTHWEPNDRTHPAFGAALRQAAAQGVQVLAYDCLVTPDSLQLDQPMPVRLDAPQLND